MEKCRGEKLYSEVELSVVQKDDIGAPTGLFEGRVEYVETVLI